jgi:hypothetical protein
MTQRHDDKSDAMTRGMCNDRRATTWKWIGIIGAIVSLIATTSIAIAGVYVIPAVSAGYKAQAALDLHEAGQEKLQEKLKELEIKRDEFIESKFKTMRDYRREDRNVLDRIYERVDLQKDQLTALQATLDAQNNSTE